MACNVLTEILKDCNSNLGGLKEVWFVKLADISVLEYTDFVVTSMLTDVPFVKFETPLNTATYTVDYATDELGIQEFTHNLTIRISKRRPTAHAALTQFLDTNPDLVALVKDGNSRWWLLGYENGLNPLSGAGGSGTSKADGSTYEFTLNGVEEAFEISVPDAIVATLIV